MYRILSVAVIRYYGLKEIGGKGFISAYSTRLIQSIMTGSGVFGWLGSQNRKWGEAIKPQTHLRCVLPPARLHLLKPS